MGFVAEEVVEPLDYDFSFFGGPKGTSPEPTDGQVSDFLSNIRKIMSEAGYTVADGKLSIQNALAMAEENKAEELFEALIQAFSDVCSNQPTAEEIAALPSRIKRHYMGWLLGQLMSPKSPSSGGDS